MLFPLLVPVPMLFQSEPPLPQSLRVLKPCPSFPWACRHPSLLGAPRPLSFLHLLSPSCVHASVLLFPGPEVWLSSTLPPVSSLSRERLGGGPGGGEGDTTWAPFLCSVPLTTLDSLFLAFPRSRGLLGPHRGGLFLWPPPFCSHPQRLLGCVGPCPGSASPPISATQPLSPPQGPAQEQNFT